MVASAATIVPEEADDAMLESEGSHAGDEGGNKRAANDLEADQEGSAQAKRRKVEEPALDDPIVLSSS